MRGGPGAGEGSDALRMRANASRDVEAGLPLGDFADGANGIGGPASPSSPIEAAKRLADTRGGDAVGTHKQVAHLWGFPLRMQGKDLALFLASGALVSYLGFTSTQESVFASAGPGGFKHGGAVTLVTTLVYGILAFLERFRAGEHLTRRGKWRDYFVLAALTSSGMYATNAALRYLNYTTRIVAKSSKVIPTMIIGTVVQGRRYGLNEYLAASLLVAGIALFTMGDVDARPSFDPRGVGLIVAALFLDSFAANFEERRLFDVPEPASHAEVVFHANAVGAVFTVCAMGVTGELRQAMESLGFLRSASDDAFYVEQSFESEPSDSGAASVNAEVSGFADALPAVLASATFGYISVSFILLLIRHFGASNAEIVKSTRKLVSIGASLVLYPKPMGWKYAGGTLSTVCGLAYLYVLKRRKLNAAAPGAGWEAAK
jgi:adenosine 3'-phospho 5'-phosphosulfate transporter B3